MEFILEDSCKIMKKYSKLVEIFKEVGSAVIAYSGGVDSTLLIKAAKDSGINALAVTGHSPTIPARALKEAISMASEVGIPYRIIETREMEKEEFRKNTKARCFFCKDTLFRELKDIAVHEGYLSVMEGSNLDDPQDNRPGMRANSLHNVRSPLIEAGITKPDVRNISKLLGLKTWDRPSSPCLSSRFPYGTPIDEAALKVVERAEDFFYNRGFRGFRVRHHGDLARIEVMEEDIKGFFETSLRTAVVTYFLSLGYKYVSLDLEGFESGKLNR